MQASKDFAVNFSKLVLYRVQPKGINPRFGAQSEPLPPNAEFNLMPKYIEAWKDEYIDAEVYHGGLVTYSVQLRKVIYTPGDHTKHKLVDSETGELVTYDCGQYAIWDMTAYKESTLKYVFSASHVEETLGRELASKLHPILHFQPNPQDSHPCHRLMNIVRGYHTMSYNTCHPEIPKGRSENDYRLGPRVEINHPSKGRILMSNVFSMQNEHLSFQILQDQQFELNFWLATVYEKYIVSEQREYGEVFLCAVAYLVACCSNTMARDKAYRRQQAIPHDQNVFENREGVRIIYENLRDLVHPAIGIFERLTLANQDSSAVKCIAALEQDSRSASTDITSAWFYMGHLSRKELPPLSVGEIEQGKE